MKYNLIGDRGERAATTSERRDGWDVLQEMAVSNRSAAGVSVTADSSLSLLAVYACVRVIAETMATMPLFMYERVPGGGKQKARNHYLFELLHDAPNSHMSAFEYRETLQGHLLLRGNAYSEIVYDNRGRVVELWPLNPDSVLQIRKADDGRLYYQYQKPNGKLDWLPQDIVWHLRGLSSDGILGYRPVWLMRQAIGLGLASQQFGAKFFSNGAIPGGVLRHPARLNDEAFERLRKSWASQHQGIDQASRVAILEEDMSYEQIGIPPEDAQFLETRKFTVQEIAGAFRVPQHKIGNLERATFSNIEHQAIEFKTDTIEPWARRWEQSITQQLLLRQERPRYYPGFLLEGLLRGDTMTRYQAYATGRQWGWLSADDVRELENMNPLPDGQGEDYLQPLNMVPAGYLQPLNMVPAGTEFEPYQENDSGQRGATGAEGRGLSPEGQEQRARQSAAARKALIADYLPLFEDIMSRIVRREAADVKRLARKHLGGAEDLAGFLLWLDGFYNEDHRAFVQKNMAPAYKAYAGAVMRAVAAEVGSDEELGPGEFVDAYAETYASRYTSKQRLALVDLIERTQLDQGEVLPAIEARMDEWDELRPAQEAARETHRANNAIAMFALGALGVVTKRWVALGDSCPYCSQLDGRTISVTQSFLPAGSVLQGGERGPLTISNNIGHPPAHDGCDCMVVAG